MHNDKTQHGYLLLFRGTDWHKQLSPEEIQRIMGEWAAWYERLDQTGKIAAASPLENEGRVITGRNREVADGPFAEAKESVGGFFLLKVDTFDEAVAIGQQCPALPHGITVEVRPVAPACPAARMAGEAAAMA
jgi:hypothetical protein